MRNCGFFPHQPIKTIRTRIKHACSVKAAKPSSKMVDPILNTHISETTGWIIRKLNTLYVEGHKFYWLNLQRKVQIFVGSMTDFHKCSI